MKPTVVCALILSALFLNPSQSHAAPRISIDVPFVRIEIGGCQDDHASCIHCPAHSTSTPQSIGTLYCYYPDAYVPEGFSCPFSCSI